ncbi:LAMI_0D11210g1_1 [Lachancea mirantina]|uniref:LAMI_0D11210g1_1 n=1 Tax=Lachancea mirantina TaxID=1230905 RepID=A0A1G4JEY5_9SACH|nr:LAMI_0D11210g1_1 [Lachancea mirantina]
MDNKHLQKANEFAIDFPIPQRVVALFLAGLWLWLWLLHVLSKTFNIDLAKLILTHDPYDIHPQTSSSKLVDSTRKCVFRITKIILPWYVITVLLLHKTLENPLETPAWLVCLINISPLCQLIATFAVLLSWSPMLCRCFKHILKFGDIESRPLRNNYILISDTMTSFAKPMIDFGIYLSNLLTNPDDVACMITRNVSPPLLNFDLLIGVTPATIRLLQSLREWRRSTSSHEARCSIFNALKYACNLPILVCTVVARASGGTSTNIYWFMLANSLYGFWWDLTMDWNLGVFNFSSNGMRRNEILRSQRTYPRFFYFTAAVIDLGLRLIWLWELFAGGSVFVGELNFLFQHCAEIFRRWLWIFMKLDAEACKSMGPEKAQE